MTGHAAIELSNRRRFTVDEVEKLVSAGVLREDDRIELIAGDLIVMSPQGPVHIMILLDVAERLRRLYVGEHHVRTQAPLVTDEYGLPEPDIAVVRGGLRDYADRHPTGADAILVVEVAVTSHDVDHDKADVYAEAGVPVYWIIDIANRRLEVHRHPKTAYGAVTILGEDEDVDLPGTDARWRVTDLLP